MLSECQSFSQYDFSYCKIFFVYFKMELSNLQCYFTKISRTIETFQGLLKVSAQDKVVEVHQVTAALEAGRELYNLLRFFSLFSGALVGDMVPSKSCMLL